MPTKLHSWHNVASQLLFDGWDASAVLFDCIQVIDGAIARCDSNPAVQRVLAGAVCGIKYHMWELEVNVLSQAKERKA